MTKSRISTPKKAMIIGGRVNKSNGTPTKKRGTAIEGIKEKTDREYDLDSMVSLSRDSTNHGQQLE